MMGLLQRKKPTTGTQAAFIARYGSRGTRNMSQILKSLGKNPSPQTLRSVASEFRFRNVPHLKSWLEQRQK